MNWQKLIEQQPQSASIIEGNSLIPLPGRQLIRIAGDEAQSFLQNLLTNDVNALQVNQSQLSGFCNPKGRLLAVFQLVRRQDDYLIVLPAELADAISQRLNMFKLRSKVEIGLLEGSHVLGLIHPQTGLGSAEAWQGHSIDEGLIIRQPGETSRSLLITEEKNVAALADWLKQDWQLVAASVWQCLEIEAGLPMVFAESRETFTPQQINLDLAGGVSFKKGCYPGQEVVARLHYLGSPSRRLFLGRLHDDTLPEINSEVTDADGATLGHVVQAQFSAEKTIVCQLSMKLSAIGKTALVGEQKVESLTPLAAEPDSA
jgi:folate-binding protein YgfZ